jgi:hypothetical protein
MPETLEEAYGTQSQKGPDEVGFFESALAGVATGLWNIPKGVLSLGAEVFDLAGDTDMARDVEEWFDEQNPWDDEAEARTVGKITAAITAIAPLAITGWGAGIKGAEAIRKMAQGAITAKRTGKYLSLAKMGEKIMGAEKLSKKGRLIGGVVGGGLGEAVVADEDIGTFADMARGTSLEPYAITMMDTSVDKTGREDAFRRLKNRLKFGTEGALFNLALIGAGRGIQKLRHPAEGKALDEWSRNKLKRWSQEYLEFGFTARGTGTTLTHEAKGTAKDFQKAIQKEADRLVSELDLSMSDLGKSVWDDYFIARKGIKETRTGQELFMKDLLETMSPISTKADRLLKKGIVDKRVADLAPVLKYKEVQKELIELATQTAGKMSDDELKAALNTLSKKFQDLKTAYPAIKAGPGVKAKPGIEEMVRRFNEKGMFTIEDYGSTKALDDILKRVEKAGGPGRGAKNAKRMKEAILNMRMAGDNMSGLAWANPNVKTEIRETIRQNFGRYMTKVYRQYEQKGFMGFFKFKPTEQMFTRSEGLLYNAKLWGFASERINKAVEAMIEPVVRTETAKLGKAGKTVSPKQLKDIKSEAIKAIDPERMAKIKKDAWAEVNKMKEDPQWVERMMGNVKEEVKQEAKRLADDSVDPRQLAESNINKEELATLVVKDEALRKKVLLPWQEEIAGIIKDPSYTFLATVGKQANLNAMLKYMDDIAKIGSQGDDPFIQTGEQLKKRGVDLTDRYKWKLVESNSTRVTNPLVGRYIKAPVYDSIFAPSNDWLNKSFIGPAYKYSVLNLKAASQISKTILSGLTHVRNALSAGAFVAANGAFFPNYGDIKLLNPFSDTAIYRQAWNLSGKRIFGTLTKKETELVQRMLRVGVTDSQVQATETKRLLGDILNDPAKVDRNMYTKMPGEVGIQAKRKALKLFGKLQDAYIAEDDFWKIINWNLERNRYTSILDELGIKEHNFKPLTDYNLPRQAAEGETVAMFTARQAKTQDAIRGLIGGTVDEKQATKIAEYFSDIVQRRDYINSGVNPGEQFRNFIDEIAGNLTRNQVPNYAYVGRTPQALRMSPFGNFIAFPLEIMRTGNNIMTRSIGDIHSGIPVIEKLGYRRLASFGATVVGVPAALVGTMKAFHDVDDEEMDALRKMVPEWSKNSTLVPMGRDKQGYLKYMDFSYSNAYDTLIRPVMAIYRGLGQAGQNQQSLMQSLGVGMADSMTEILKPYATESIYTEALIDSVFRLGVGKGGRRVWSEEDDFGVRMAKGIAHVFESLEPGSLKQYKRLAQAATGTTDEYGRSFNLMDELPGLYGGRIINSDPERAMKFMVTDFGSSLKKDDNLFQSPLLKGGRVTPKEIVERFKYAESRRFQTMKEMYKNIDAAEILGMPTHKIRQEVEKRKGIKRDIIDNLLRGQYTPHEPSEFFIDRMAEINRELNAVEGVNISNPYYQAVPYIREIIQANRRLKLLVDEMNLPEQDVPTPAGPVQEKAEDFFNLSVGGGGGGGAGGFNLDEGVVKAFNQGTGTDQISPVTGLTYVEDSLLKPWEKAYRIKQNQKRT